MSFVALRSLKASLRPRPCLVIRQFHLTPRWAEQFLDANQKTLEKVVSDTTTNGEVVLVDFYADWCGPCKMLSPILENLTKDTSIKTGSGSSLNLVTVDTDQQVELGQKYQIRSLPTVIAFKAGKPVDQFIGAMNDAGVRQFLQNV